MIIEQWLGNLKYAMGNFRNDVYGDISGIPIHPVIHM